MKPLDYTLYNQVKEKFPPQPATVIFISLAPENLAKLEGVVFGPDNIAGLGDLIGQHGCDATPYAAIGGIEEGDIRYHFSSHEFEQEEDLITGKVVYLSIGTYHNNPPDIEALKKEMKQFVGGFLISGNA